MEVNPSSKRFGAYLRRLLPRLRPTFTGAAEVLRFLLLDSTLLLVTVTSDATKSNVAGSHFVAMSLVSQTIPNATPTQLPSQLVASGTEVFFAGHFRSF